MVYIREGYCYDADTKIIYRESIIDGGRYSYDAPVYSPYINENGNYCKYEYGKWVEFIKTPWQSFKICYNAIVRKEQYEIYYSSVNSDNIASQKIAESVGFKVVACKISIVV